jgi:hypothetical protein
VGRTAISLKFGGWTGQEGVCEGTEVEIRSPQRFLLTKFTDGYVIINMIFISAFLSQSQSYWSILTLTRDGITTYQTLKIQSDLR